MIFIFLVSAFAAIPVVVIAADKDPLIRQLESVATADTLVFGLRDGDGRSMDCLKVFQPIREATPGTYYGVYHYRKNGIFAVHLARSKDLINWEHITSLDDHGSQPTVWTSDRGAYLLAYEKDKPNSCWIRVRSYKNLSDLLGEKSEYEFDISRTLAPTAEGTPSIESVKWEDERMEPSEVKLRFHFYKNVDVDQLAQGRLTDFKSWEAEPASAINAEFIKRGWHGNLGDRDKFVWDDKAYYLQEIQKKKNDWSSWRVCLCDETGMPIHALSIRTAGGSTAFANPNTTWITDADGQRKLVVTLFLPSEGNASTEAGTLLYVINPSTTKSTPKQ